MGFIIHQTPRPDKVIRVGYGQVVSHVIPEVSTPIPQPKKRGRPKMADKMKDESGVETIHKEPADKQGPVGTGSENPPQPAAGEDVKIGEGDKENAR